jgi:antitoxin component YwqK of YwqJK toxin-antitoxin module
MLIALPMLSCHREQGAKTDAWFDRTRKEIIRQSDYMEDSVGVSYNHDSSFVSKYYYLKGRKMKVEGYNRGRLVTETDYSEDGNFEFRREICKNGDSGFEGFFYKNEAYGLSTWYYCSVKSMIELQGVRYKNEKIGVWRKWSRRGRLLEEINYGKEELLDSLPKLR